MLFYIKWMLSKMVKKKPKLHQHQSHIPVTKKGRYSISEKFMKLLQCEWQTCPENKMCMAHWQNSFTKCMVAQGIAPAAFVAEENRLWSWWSSWYLCLQADDSTQADYDTLLASWQTIWEKNSMWKKGLFALS